MVTLQGMPTGTHLVEMLIEGACPKPHADTHSFA